MHTPRSLESTRRVHVGSFTPAVNLTEDLPQGKDADILLLGCGDLRHILYTCFVDQGLPERKLDFTACDIDEYIIARNIIFLTFLLDNDDDILLDQLWNIYYSFYLDSVDVSIVGNQAKKLLPFSRSLQDWHASPYGATLRFCDEITLSLVHGIWAVYAVAALFAMPSDGREWEAFEANLHDARQKKEATIRISKQDVSRSCAPLAMKIADQVLSSTKQHWGKGRTDSVSLPESRKNELRKVPNPLFAVPLMKSSSLQDPTNPLLSFHLAAAHAKLAEQSPLWLEEKHSGSLDEDRLFKIAFMQFSDWTNAFIAAASRTVLRFTVSDCFALCYTLRYNAETGETCAQWYRGETGFDVLRLADSEYGPEGSTPVRFDIIDTSTLANDKSVLNLLVSVGPLLKDAASSTLYTECFHYSDDTGNLQNILSMHTTTISMLLGLVPAEYWTNAKAGSMVDDLLTAWSDETAKSEAKAATFDFRIAWKQAKHMAGQEPGAAPLRARTKDLLTLANALFIHTLGQDTDKRPAPRDELKTLVHKRWADLQHTPATMAALFNAIAGRAQADLAELRKDYVKSLLGPVTKAVASRHLCELILETPAHDLGPKDSWDAEPGEEPPFKKWASIPIVVAVTAVIPSGRWKEKVAGKEGDMSQASLGIRIAGQMLFANNSDTAAPFLSNVYADVQVSFGTIRSEGSSDQDDFTVIVEEDKAGWKGASPMIISFYALSEVVERIWRNRGGVNLITMFTNFNAARWEEVMSEICVIPDAPCREENRVFFTKYRPGQTAHGINEAALQDLRKTKEPAQDAFSSPSSFTADIDSELGEIVTITGRIDITSAEGKQLLANKVPIEVQQSSPFTFNIVFSKSTLTLPLTFPAPVLKDGSKTRIARTSGYIEIVAPLAQPTTSPRILDDYLFPTTPVTTRAGITLPATLNIPHLNLDTLPILALDDKSRTRFLTTLTSLTFSARERRLRERVQQQEADAAAPNPPSDDNDGNSPAAAGLSTSPRLNFKESLFTIFMLASGLQGGQTGLFALTHPSRGGIHALLFVSAVRLDGAHGSVVLDAAVLPLTRKLIDSGELEGFLLLLRSLECCALTVDDAELALWKRVLPALAERCRTWSHGNDNCEYVKVGKVPVSMEHGGPVLCSCGRGRLPADFVALPEWDTAAKYATRVALSPTYASALVEELVDPALAREMATGMVTKAGEGNALNACRNCGKREQGTEGVRLRKCMRCLQVVYCSAECQRKDWKKHRMECEEAEVHRQ